MRLHAKSAGILAAITIASIGSNCTAAESPWSFSSSLSVKETHDDNVFLQDKSDLAGKSSMVSSFMPSLSLGFQKTPVFKATLSYAPEFSYYHSASSEDNIAHRGAFNFGGKSDNTTWEVNNAIIGIDGDDEGVTFLTAQGGDIPAIGGVPLRDRRDATIYRNSAKVTQTLGSWFVRPVITSYVHDFKTRQSSTKGYENYIDRSDINGGLDIGNEVLTKTWLVLGYRYGNQHQGERLGVASPYSSHYQRILVGVEGTPTDWLKLNMQAGPDIRSFDEAGIPATFDKDELLWYVDASATLTLGKRDAVTVLVTRYEQPAFASHSMYEDIVYSANWKHQVTDKLAATLGMKCYGGEWQTPVMRDDWIYTPSAGVAYTFNKHLVVDLAYSHDEAKSMVPETSGREFTRNLISLGAKYTF
jgi:hypothetical protein